MTAFSSRIFQRTVIEFPSEKGAKIPHSGILKSEKGTTTFNLGFDPTLAQVFTFRVIEPPILSPTPIPGSLVEIIDGDASLVGKTLKVLSVPTRPIDLRGVVGTKITLVLEDRNYLGSPPPQ